MSHTAARILGLCHPFHVRHTPFCLFDHVQTRLLLHVQPARPFSDLFSVRLHVEWLFQWNHPGMIGPLVLCEVMTGERPVHPAVVQYAATRYTSGVASGRMHLGKRENLKKIIDVGIGYL